MQFQVGKSYRASFEASLASFSSRQANLVWRVGCRREAYEQLTMAVRCQEDVIQAIEEDIVRLADAMESTHIIPDQVAERERDECLAALRSEYGGAMVHAGARLFADMLPEDHPPTLLLGIYPEDSKNNGKRERVLAAYRKWRPADEQDWRVVCWRELVAHAETVPAIVTAKYNKIQKIQTKYRGEVTRELAITRGDRILAHKRLAMLKGKRRHHSLKKWEREVLAVIDEQRTMQQATVVKQEVVRPKGNVVRVIQPMPQVPSVSMQKPGTAQPEDILNLFVEGCGNARMAIQAERCTLVRNKKRIWVVKAFDAVGNPFDFHMTKGYQAKLDRMAATRQ